MTQVAHDIIKINGLDKNWIFNGLSLRQSYNDHHIFEISILIPQPPKPTKENVAVPALTQDSLLNILGEDAYIKICATGKKSATCNFKGFVDQVIPAWTSRACTLRIIGYSPTLFMDCGPKFRTFYKKPLSEIIQKITGAYCSKLNKPIVNGAGIQSDFSVQTQETDYRYLCRLADGYGKVFYYDGMQLHFGDLESKTGKSATNLHFEEDIKQANLSLNLAPLSFSIGAYQLESGKLISKNVVNKDINNAVLINKVIQKSSVYPASSLHLFNVAANEIELQNKSQRLLAKQAHDLVRLTGVSDSPSLKVGSKIAISGTKELIGQGEFIIIEVNHIVNNDYSYSNTFTAVPAGYPFPARMQNSRNPLCGPLMGIVKDHDDPQQLGRVRVQFIGDEEQTLSPWLRVLTPYTGNGGMAFLPEAGDEVVVEAEDFNIEKFPFVNGAFYQGKAPANQWFEPKNKKKGFTTEKVAFQIDDRTGILKIEAEEIEIIARKKMKTEAEEMEFVGKKNMKIKGGRHLTQEAERIDLNP